MNLPLHLLRVIGSTVLLFANVAAIASGDDRPITGKKVSGAEPLEAAILSMMDTIGCHGATVAVSKDGRLVYSRGFGWKDAEKKTPTPPDAFMRIASISKPITAAMVKGAIRSRLLSHDAKAFPLVGLEPPQGKLADPRIMDITIQQILDHKGGWDSAKSGDPMFKTAEIAMALHLEGPVAPADVVRYMLGQPLDFAPGQKYAYSNFGYCVLGRVLERAAKRPYGQCLDQAICRPLGIRDLKLAASDTAKRDPREVWYPVADDAFSMEVMDAHGGLIASAPALSQFMEAYWLHGDPRPRGAKGGVLTFFGSIPGTTAMTRQRADGYNVAVLMNARREDKFSEDNDLLLKRTDEAIDSMTRRP